jgi:hypothetical protein
MRRMSFQLDNRDPYTSFIVSGKTVVLDEVDEKAEEVLHSAEYVENGQALPCDNNSIPW